MKIFSKEKWEEAKTNFAIAIEKGKENYAKNEAKRKSMFEFGEKMRKFGTTCTIGLTLPILLSIFFGPIGMIIGALLFLGSIGKIFDIFKSKNS